MSFASYSKGYKAGGFEQRLALPTAQAPTFESEFVDAYELGFKSVIANRTLRLNGSVFYMDYKGIQCAVVKGIAPTTINCGNGEILGVEFEGNWVPGPEWLIDFNLGYLDAQWAKGTLTPQAATVGISENNKFAMVPEWQTAVGVSYEFGLGSRGTVTPRVDWSYRSEIYKDAPNTEVLRQDGLHLLNVSIAWLSLDEKYEIAVRGRNITDEEYIMTGVMQPDGGFAEAVYSRGAEWWISAQYNF
jgi:iron complex outermembrane receptor protein